MIQVLILLLLLLGGRVPLFAADPLPGDAEVRVASAQKAQDEVAAKLASGELGDLAKARLSRDASEARLKALIPAEDQKLPELKGPWGKRFAELQREQAVRLVMSDVVRGAISAALVRNQAAGAGPGQSLLLSDEDFAQALEKTFSPAKQERLKRLIGESFTLAESVFKVELADVAAEARTALAERDEAAKTHREAEELKKERLKLEAAKKDADDPHLKRVFPEDRLQIKAEVGAAKVTSQGESYGDRSSKVQRDFFVLQYAPDYFAKKLHEGANYKVKLVFDPKLQAGFVYMPIERSGASEADSSDDIEWSRVSGFVVAPLRLDSKHAVIDLASVRLLALDRDPAAQTRRLGGQVDFLAGKLDLRGDSPISALITVGYGFRVGQETFRNQSVFAMPSVLEGSATLKADLGKAVQLMAVAEAAAVGTVQGGDGAVTSQARAEALAKFRFKLVDMPMAIGTGAGIYHTTTDLKFVGASGHIEQTAPYGTLQLSIEPSSSKGGAAK